MKKLLSIFALLLAAPLAWGHTCTLSGNYTTLASTAGHWTGTGCTGGSYVAGSGDTAIFSAANLTVASGETWNIGTSNGALAISCSSPTDTTSTFIVAVGAALHLLGDNIQQCFATWQMNGTFTYDSSGNSSPSTANYTWDEGAHCNSAPCAILEFNGTSSTPFTVQIAAGSGNFGGFGTGTYNSSGAVQMTWGNVSNCGTSSQHCIYSHSGYYVGVQSSITWTVFNNYGQIQDDGNQTGTSASFIFENNKLMTAIDASARAVTWGGLYNDSTWTCQVTNNTIHGTSTESTGPSSANWGQDNGCITNGNWLLGTATASGYQGNLAGHANGHFDGNVAYNQPGATGIGYPAGYVTRMVVLLVPDESGGGPHLYGGGPSSYQPTYFIGGTVERQYNSTSGAEGTSSCFYAGGTGFAVTVENWVTIPSPNGYSPCALVNVIGASVSGAAYTAVHNTAMATPTANGFGTFMGEGSTGGAGLFPNIESNLFFLTTSTAGAAYDTYWYNSSTPVNDTFGTVDYNGQWNITGSPYGSIYGGASSWYLTTPGTHDVRANPNFLGCYDGSTTSVSNCNFEGFARFKGITYTTWADIIAQADCMNNASGLQGCSFWNSTILEYYYWVQQGFAPTNAAFHNTAADGGDIGAVPYYATPTVPSQFSSLLTTTTDYTCAGVADPTCATWPMPANPGKGNSYSDPLFGTTTWELPVGAANTYGDVLPIYSRVQGFNSDNTLLMVSEDGGPPYMDLYNATTTPPTFINRITTSDGTSLNSWGGDANWAFTNRTRIYYIPFDDYAGSPTPSMQLRYVDVSTCTTSSCVLTPTVVHTFSCTADSYAPSPITSGTACNQIETGWGAQGGMGDNTDDNFSFHGDVVNESGQAIIDWIHYTVSTNTTFQEKWYGVCTGGVPSGCLAYSQPSGTQGYNMLRMNQHPDKRYITILWQNPSGCSAVVRGCGTEAYGPSYNFLGPLSGSDIHQDTGFDVNGYPIWAIVESNTGTRSDNWSLAMVRLDTLSLTSYTTKQIQLPCPYAYASSPPCASGTYLYFKQGAPHISLTGTWGTTPGYGLFSNMMIDAGSGEGFNPDYPPTTTLGTAVTSTGPHTVAPGSMSQIATGVQLFVGQGTANAETVTVTGTTSSTFTATFANTHASTETVANLTVGDTGVYAMENDAIQFDTTQPSGAAAKVWRMGRAMSIRDADYGAEPHSFFNRDSSAFVWGSNWNVDQGVDNGYYTALTGGTSYTLTVSTAGSGSGSISGTNCSSGSYASGTTIGACTATPSAGSTFAGWSGTLGCTGTGTCTETLTGNSTMIATFNTTSTNPPQFLGGIKLNGGLTLP
jgi:hypothetical protein